MSFVVNIKNQLSIDSLGKKAPFALWENFHFWRLTNLLAEKAITFACDR